METANLVIQAIAALGSVLAALASREALKIARQANELAEKTSAESAAHVQEANRLALEATQQAEHHARESERREEMRDQRRIASNMHAWWVTKPGSGVDLWGIIVSNTGPETSVFYDITLEFTSNYKPAQFKVAMLPPGTYFLESRRAKDQTSSLAHPEALAGLKGFKPLLNAKSHSVDELAFTDQVGQKWVWSREDGLNSF